MPHCTGFGVQKPGGQARHRSTKAEGGWAAVNTEYCAISADSDETPFISARLWDDGDLRALSLMCDEVHEHDALAGVELHHSGVHCPRREWRLPAIGPSQLASDYLLVTPKAMERDDIRRVQEDWAAAARRAREAGFDIVYVYGAHSYLPMQFLSPFYNRRTDEYGGSLENRARFWMELLELTREAVDGECTVATRISVAALSPYGVDLDEGLEFVRLADHLVDLWDVAIGSATEWSKDSGASRFFKQGWQLEWTKHVREATAKPIVGVSRLTDPDQMAEIVSSGVWDVIGAARPSIADPFLPRKIEEGRLDEIRECIGCNICIPKSDPGGNIGCTQNATAGEEFRRGWHPERFEPAENRDRDVLVVGAGPAGMECAIVLGKRGFRRVHLVDAGDDIGGIMRWIPQLPGRGEWARVLNWRRIQLDKLRNVEVLTGMRLDADGVREYGAEIVVVATGRALGHRRPEPGDPRADPRRRRLPAARPHARADHGRGQDSAREARRRLRLGRLLHGPRPGRAAGSRRVLRRLRDVARRHLPVLARDAGAGLPQGAAPRGRRPDAPHRQARAHRDRPESRAPTSSASRSSSRPTRSCSSPRGSPTTRSTTSSAPTRSASRPRGSRLSTGSATASRPSSSRTRSSTGTGSRARSTARIPPCPCLTSASDR